MRINFPNENAVMKKTTKKSVAFLLTCLLLLLILDEAAPAIGGCDECDGCEECVYCDCVYEGCDGCGSCRYCDEDCDCQWIGNCLYSYQCGDCESCVNCNCQCTSACCNDSHCPSCHECINCNCVDQCNSNLCQDCNIVTDQCEDRCVDPHTCLQCDGNGSCVSACDPNLCQDCNDGTCEDRCVDPLTCLECDGNGNCVSTCADCLTCVAGDCVDIQCAVLGECEECNETTGECESICGPDQCCDNNICVDKCDPDGGSMCTWTDPPVQDPICEYATPEMPFCINPDATCNWEPTSGPGLNATCADCAPGCTTSEACVVLRPVLCYEGLSPLPPWYMCKCGKIPALYDPVPRGTRDICP